jgi:hypothetical protein
MSASGILADIAMFAEVTLRHEQAFADDIPVAVVETSQIGERRICRTTSVRTAEIRSAAEAGRCPSRALHSGDPAFDALPAYFEERLRPAKKLFDSAASAGQVRADMDPNDLLGAVASLCMTAHDQGCDRADKTPSSRSSWHDSNCLAAAPKLQLMATVADQH